MTEPDLARAEAWFVAHGLPYFVDDIRAQVHDGLRRSRLVALGALTLVAALASGLAAGWWRERVGFGLTVAAQVAVLVLAVYALTTLRARVIAVWAARHTFASLGLLFPLVTRALPLLLLFITFLFINAEVWEVSATLDGSVMWLTVALFLAITVGFLLVRLPEELEVFDAALDVDRVVAGTRGTPLEGWRPSADHAQARLAADEQLGGLQKANLVLVLLIAQLVQVLLLSVAVFVFFVVFGLLVMDPEVIRGWTGVEHLTAVPYFERANRELLQVSVFLAAFSGLYFSVYAVTDETYRKQFFTSIVTELERAVSARAAYRALRRTRS